MFESLDFGAFGTFWYIWVIIGIGFIIFYIYFRVSSLRPSTSSPFRIWISNTSENQSRMILYQQDVSDKYHVFVYEHQVYRNQKWIQSKYVDFFHFFHGPIPWKYQVESDAQMFEISGSRLAVHSLHSNVFFVIPMKGSYFEKKKAQFQSRFFIDYPKNNSSMRNGSSKKKAPIGYVKYICYYNHTSSKIGFLWESSPMKNQSVLKTLWVWDVDKNILNSVSSDIPISFGSTLDGFVHSYNQSTDKKEPKFVIFDRLKKGAETSWKDHISLFQCMLNHEYLVKSFGQLHFRTMMLLNNSCLLKYSSSEDGMEESSSDNYFNNKNRQQEEKKKGGKKCECEHRYKSIVCGDVDVDVDIDVDVGNGDIDSEKENVVELDIKNVISELKTNEQQQQQEQESHKELEFCFKNSKTIHKVLLKKDDILFFLDDSTLVLFNRKHLKGNCFTIHDKSKLVFFGDFALSEKSHGKDFCYVHFLPKMGMFSCTREIILSNLFSFLYPCLARRRNCDVVYLKYNLSFIDDLELFGQCDVHSCFYLRDMVSRFKSQKIETKTLLCDQKNNEFYVFNHRLFQTDNLVFLICDFLIETFNS